VSQMYDTIRFQMTPKYPRLSHPTEENPVTTLNIRNRMVVFRLTQEEYVSLSDACRSKGARNLSEFTRSELLNLLRSEASPTVIKHRFDRLEDKFHEIESSIERLMDRISSSAIPEVSPLRETNGSD
jgi:hypothetical protein